MTLILLALLLGPPASSQGMPQIWEACVNPTPGMSGEFIVNMCDVVFMQPQSYPGDVSLVHLGFGEGYLRRGDFDKALYHFVQASLSLARKSDQALAYRGRARANLGLGATGAAISAFSEAFRLDPSLKLPEYGDLLVKEADRHMLVGEFSEAAEDYGKAVAVFADWGASADIDIRLSRAFRKAGKTDEAQRVLEPLIRSDDSEALRVELVLIHFARKEFGAGADDADAALKMNPNSPLALYLRGVGKQFAYVREVEMGVSTPHDELWDLGAEDIARARALSSSALGSPDLVGFLPPATKPMPVASSSPVASAPAAAGAAGAGGVPAGRPLGQATRPFWGIGAAALIGVGVWIWQLKTRARGAG